MKAESGSIQSEPEKLKPILHMKIERMNAQQLALLNRLLLQIEAEEKADRLSEAFDEDHAQGKWRNIPELVRKFRLEHRYT